MTADRLLFRISVPIVLVMLLVFPIGFVHAFTNGQNATLEIGQAAGASQFTTQVFATTQSGLNLPHDVAFDHSGNLWVADTDNNRILEFTAPFSSGEAASLEIGQPAGATQFTSNTCATTQSGLCDVDGIAFDGSGNLWVGDHDNSRALEFAASSLGTDGPSAVGVLGQSGFTSGASSTTQSTLRGNSGLTFDSSGNLWVADNFNSRVLEFASVGGPIAPVSVCPNAGGGTLMPAGATFSYGGHTWTAPSGHDGEGATWSSYFFAGPQSTVPAPMLQGWAGVYGNYAGTQGWIITFYC